MHYLLNVLVKSVGFGSIMVGLMFLAQYFKNGTLDFGRATVLMSLAVFLVFFLTTFFSTPPVPSLIRDFRTRASDWASMKVTFWKVQRKIEASRRADLEEK